jgi:large subunit ribosomal protein L24
MKRIRKGDRVQVVAGNDRGKIGRVLEVLPEKNRIIVERVHMIKRHQRATAQMREPGIVEREGTIDVSNVMPLCPECDEPTRIGFVVVDGRKMRRCKRCGEIFE